MKSIKSFANTNIALIKYWGKLPGNLNLPATGSLSLTLNGLGTHTKLSFIDNANDIFILNENEQNGEPLLRVQRFLDIVRALAKNQQRCLIESKNNIPTNSGLASSASGFAALAIAANQLYQLDLDPIDLSQLARMGSGSAARSIFGDLVYMHSGSPTDETGGYAEPIVKNPTLDVSLIIVQCSRLEKVISSRTGMIHTANTSPYYPAWVATHAEDLKKASQAVKDGDFKTLGELTEYSTLKMHACMLAANPPFWYFDPLTITVMNRIKKLRHEGANCYFTMDAGPHVKVLCPSGEAHDLAETLKHIKNVVRVDIARPGSGAQIL